MAKQHWHFCPTEGCGVTWDCYRADCDHDALCSECEQKRFETFAEAHGWTTSQPAIPELIEELEK